MTRELDVAPFIDISTFVFDKTLQLCQDMIWHFANQIKSFQSTARFNRAKTSGQPKFSVNMVFNLDVYVYFQLHASLSHSTSICFSQYGLSSESYTKQICVFSDPEEGHFQVQTPVSPQTIPLVTVSCELPFFLFIFIVKPFNKSRLTLVQPLLNTLTSRLPPRIYHQNCDLSDIY